MNEPDKPVIKKNSQKKKEPRDLNEYTRLLKFYYLPVFVLAIFFIVLFVGLLPSLGSLYDNYSARNTVKKEVKKQEQTITALNQLKNDSNQTNEYLEIINTIAPVEVVNVTDFQESIKALAQSNKLVVQQARTRQLVFAEDGTVVTQESQTNYLQLIEVPSEFVFTGNFDDIKQFLRALYKQDEFIVIEEMTFSNPLTSNDWELNIVLNKYQFQVNENADISFPNYLGVPEDARPNQDVIDFIEQKYLDTNTENTND